MTTRKFYRSKIVVEVLSEEPMIPQLSLTEIDFEITNGDWSGQSEEIVLNEEVDGPTMAQLLKAQGSDPGFFHLTDDGEDTDDEQG